MEWSVKCEVWSVNCGIECEVWSVDYKVCRVNCDLLDGVWCVEWSMRCGIECDVWNRV